MDSLRRELLTNRILSGQIKFQFFVDKCLRNFTIRRPTAELRYDSCILYNEVLREASFHGVLPDEKIEAYLIKNRLWTEQKEKRLEELLTEIENTKLSMYHSAMRFDLLDELRKSLNDLTTEYGKLYSERHTFDYLTQSGFASYVKNKYLLNNTLYIDNEKYYIHTDKELDGILKTINEDGLSEKDYRDLARNEPWRVYWMLGKEGKLFNYPVSEYSEEQRILCSWTKMYDSIYESADDLPDSIIEDDDVLDGWMIFKKQSKKQEQLKKQGENLFTNKKIANAKEVGVVVKTKEAAAAIESLNSPHAAMIKRQRAMVLKEKGVLNEAELPDVKLDLMNQIHQMVNRR